MTRMFRIVTATAVIAAWSFSIPSAASAVEAQRDRDAIVAELRQIQAQLSLIQSSHRRVESGHRVPDRADNRPTRRAPQNARGLQCHVAAAGAGPVYLVSTRRRDERADPATCSKRSGRCAKRSLSSSRPWRPTKTVRTPMPMPLVVALWPRPSWPQVRASRTFTTKRESTIPRGATRSRFPASKMSSRATPEEIWPTTRIIGLESAISRNAATSAPLNRSIPSCANIRTATSAPTPT